MMTVLIETPTGRQIRCRMSGARSQGKSRPWMAWLGYNLESTWCASPICPNKAIPTRRKVFAINGLFPVCQPCTAEVSVRLRAGHVAGHEDVIDVVAQDDGDDFGPDDHAAVIRGPQGARYAAVLDEAGVDHAGHAVLHG